MVKFRGISITMVSQFDICKLPEFKPPTSPSPDPFTITSDPPTSQPTASCYVPIYPGSQVWFDYSIEGPHPENAAYFFKMLNNGEMVTSWDCTAKYGYCGKAAYALEYVGDDEETGTNLVNRHAFRFRVDNEEETEKDKGKEKLEDCLEIRVHRIEHRQRIGIDSGIGTGILPTRTSALSLAPSGQLQPGSPERRYRYQLLDPVNEPYATFRFYYRTYEFLEENNIVTYDYDASNYCQNYFSAVENPTTPETKTQTQECQSSPISPKASKATVSGEVQESLNVPSGAPTVTFLVVSPSMEETSSEEESIESAGRSFAKSDSETSLRLVTKDSIEDLSSTVPRSPRCGNLTTHADGIKFNQPASPSKLRKSPPKKLHKKNLTINLGGTEFNLDKKMRPLSPFTSSGILRRIMSPTPPSAPAAVTEFGPNIWDELEGKLGKADEGDDKQKTSTTAKAKGCERTTRADRGGKSLMGFLGRRIAKID